MLMVCTFYKLVSEIVIKMLLDKKNKVKKNMRKSITKNGAMKHPGIIKNLLLSKVCFMERERERNREREK